MRFIFGVFLVSAVVYGALMFSNVGKAGLLEQGVDLMNTKPEGYPTVTLAGGCFWCTESEYRALDGVLYTRVGYMGGQTDNPTYRDITTGRTGHAEVVRVTYDPEKITYEALLEFFLTKAHDPTQLNRQGVDKGTQYRSAIFYADEDEKAKAEAMIAKIDKQKVWGKPIVTTLEPESTFWDGEEYHQQYYEKYKETNGNDHIRVLLKKSKKAIGGL